MADQEHIQAGSTKIIDFKNRIYYFDKLSGYYKTHMRSGERRYLHRDIYSSVYGNIPHGWEVHHRNEDKDDNQIDNYECLPSREHNQRHLAQLQANGRQTIHLTRIRKQFTCEGCGTVYMGKDNGRNRWCSKRCANAYHNARHP